MENGPKRIWRSRALEAYRNEEGGLNSICRQYGIPKATLRRHFLQRNKYANGIKHFGRPTTLPSELERLLVEYIIEIDSMLFEIGRSDLMSLAYQIAEENNLNHVFNKEKKSAGKHWYYDFMCRHPDLSLRQPEPTSLGRAKGFNRKSVGEFFTEGAPEGSLVVNNKSGWMDKDLFLQWLKHFHATVKSAKEKPVLLILDGHASHTKTIEVINFACNNGITYKLSLPP